MLPSPLARFRTIALCLAGLCLTPLTATAQDLPPPGTDGPSERAYEVAVLSRILDPVLVAGAAGKLKEELPKSKPDRDAYAPLEALGRSLAGAAPWLELGPGDDPEGKLRARDIGLAVKAISQAVDPKSPAYLNFTKGGQPLVDAAFLAQALLRAPHQLWGNLDVPAQANVIQALKSTRAIKPGNNNWLLFSAMVEATLLKTTGECDTAPIEKAVASHMAWYKGDGMYGDGPAFHWDYYNSFVIHPMLWEVLAVCDEKKLPVAAKFPLVQTRARRYAAELERMISPEGTYPVIGRSATYRFAAFQMLSLAALSHQLPDGLAPGRVRAGLNAVIHRVIAAPGTFDPGGWLTIGVAGPQPGLADDYISRGSEYLCTEGLLQLGLPPDDPFWTVPDQAWTQKKIWSGENVPVDHAISE